jgi:sporulation protein YlmC with PRC-barrel domain
MRISELLGCRVIDAAGKKVGTVIDVRLAVDGDLDDSPAAPRVLGLVIGPHTAGAYLGYERTSVAQPVLLQKLVGWRHRGAFVCQWSDVDEIDSDTVVLAAGFTRYSPLLPKS